MQELLQSWVLSRGTTVSCRVSELWAVGDTKKGCRAPSKARKAEQQEGKG